jgi:hypothetical protein
MRSKIFQEILDNTLQLGFKLIMRSSIPMQFGMGSGKRYSEIRDMINQS